MNKSAEISKDGRTLTVNTFKDLKHFLDRVRYKHFQITVDKPIKELIIKDSKTDLTVNYVTEVQSWMLPDLSVPRKTTNGPI